VKRCLAESPGEAAPPARVINLRKPAESEFVLCTGIFLIRDSMAAPCRRMLLVGV
jgi:hypothetical protein